MLTNRLFSVAKHAVFFGIMLLPISTGCQSRNSWEVTQPASGTVVFKGKPIENAEINLFPVDPAAPELVRPRGRTTADGKFVLWTYKEGDGVPVGKYKATIVHNAVSVSKDTVVAKPNDLPVKYSKRDSTDLEVTIIEGKNEIPFELK